MAPKAEKNVQKYGMPLYGVAFLSETLLAVGGGGGKKSSGIPNRRAPAAPAHTARAGAA